MNDLMKAYDLLMTIKPITNDMEENGFMSFYCMLLEEWCKTKGLYIEEVLASIVLLINEVNISEGRY